MIPVFLKRPGVRKLLVTVLVLGFLLSLIAMVTGQARDLEPYAQRMKAYRSAMLFGLGFFLLAALYSICSGANILTFCAAVTVLYAIGVSFQILFAGFEKQLLLQAGSLVTACLVFLVWRHNRDISDAWYTALVVAALVLLVLQLFFTKELNGARLWIRIGSFSLQPGEFIKPVLVLLGAGSYRKSARSFLYFVITLLSIAIFVLFKDLGTAVVLFCSLVLVTYLTFDSELLSLGLIGIALAAFIGVLMVSSYARTRFGNWGNVMEIPGSQQSNYIKGVLFGGFSGLGLPHAHIMTGTDRFVSTDASLAAVLAVYGVPILLLTMLCYGLLVLQAAHNRSIFPANHLVLCQVGVMIFINAMLNLCGSLDLLPFTGVTAPLISYGGSSALSFGAMLGLQAAALNPAIHPPKRRPLCTAVKS